MKTRWKITLVVSLIAAASWFHHESASKAPDQKLVGHLDNMCKIAEGGIASPYKGVQKLFTYYAKNTPEMFKEWGELLVMIEGIKDDGAHDERARVAGRRLFEAVAGCERTWERFGLAIEDNEKASRLVERGANRLGRTLEILFSGGVAGQMAFLPGFEELLSASGEDL